MNEQAYQWLKAWFLERYEDPVETCPHESGEGGYFYLWGGPFDASEELLAAWDGVFEEAFLEAVATRLCDECDCFEWSGAVDPDSPDEAGSMDALINDDAKTEAMDRQTMTEEAFADQLQAFAWEYARATGTFRTALRGMATSLASVLMWVNTIGQDVPPEAMAQETAQLLDDTCAVIRQRTWALVDEGGWEEEERDRQYDEEPAP